MKILFVDIESSDLAADIGHIIAIGYKFADDKKTTVLDISHYPGKSPNDDKKLLKAFEPIFRQADLVVHHFGEFFDVPFIQTRRLINGMKPLPEVSFVDTWRICKKKLKLGSNRLDRILDVLGCPVKKTPIRLSVWAAARVGDKRAIRYIVDHCSKDVDILEFVYNKIKPIWVRHPRMFVGKNCPQCNGKSKSEGLRVCAQRIYRRMVCLKCGNNWKGEVVK